MVVPTPRATGTPERVVPSNTNDPTPRACINHPARETLVRCGRCGRPFCPDCLVYTPAGQRCYECAGIRRSAAGEALLVGLGKAVTICAIGSLIGGALGSPLYRLIVGLVAGAMMGQGLSPLINRRNRAAVFGLAAVALVVGSLLGVAILGAALPTRIPVPLVDRVILTVIGSLRSLFFWMFVFAAGAMAYQRMR